MRATVVTRPVVERRRAGTDALPEAWLRQLSAPRGIEFGIGALNELGRVVTSLRVRRPLVVVSGRSWASGLRSRVATLLNADSCFFSAFESNPTTASVALGVARFRGGDHDGVVGVGGGSALDVAKAVAFLGTREGSVDDCVIHGRAFDAPRTVPLVLVPTTAGTGSEVTCFAALYGADGTKFSLEHPSLRADAAIVDPELSSDVPVQLAAASGFDALAQAVESYWSIRSTPESRSVAAMAIRIAVRSIHAATVGEASSRVAMSLCALLSGYAIDVTRTTAAHAVSYALGARLRLPHGHACAITLPGFLVFNAAANNDDVQDPRGASFVGERVCEVATLLGANTPELAADVLRSMMDCCGLETRLSRLGATRETLEYVANHWDAARARNNPRRVTREAVLDVLEGAL